MCQDNVSLNFKLWRYEFLTDVWKKLEMSGDAPEGLASAAGKILKQR